MMMNRSGLRIAAAFLLAGAPAPALAAKAVPVAEKTTDKIVGGEARGAEKPLVATPTLKPDPAVRFGTFANGLHYAIMANKTPTGAVSVRLAFNVGSYNESDDELGYAHFIEHMAFRSTRLAPGGVLDDRFARLGVAFGRDQNAITTLRYTLYSVDLPNGDPAGVKDVLAWLRSGAEDILFTPAAVDAERKVVLAELTSRESPLTEVQREVTRFQLPELRSGQRDPGGTIATLNGAGPARFQAFYDRWYRPENATLIIVGDAPVESMQALAEQAFASWKGRGTAGSLPPPPARLPERGEDSFALSNTALTSVMSSCRYAGKPAPEKTFDSIKTDILSKLWSDILRERLKHLAATPGSSMLGAMPVVNHDLPDAIGACLIVVPTAGKWKEALQQGQAELRRFAAEGPTPAEVERVIEELRSRLRGAIVVQATRKSDDLANQIAGAAIDDKPFQSPADALDSFESAVRGVSPGDVSRAFAADWRGNGPLLSIVAPEPPAKESLLAAWRENEQAAPLEAYSDRAAATWDYEFGKPGKVERREVMTRPDYVRLSFRNGAILNFRQTKLESGHVEIRVRFGRGQSGLAPADRGPAVLAAGLFQMGGLGKMDYEQVSSVYENTTWNFALEIPSTAFVLSSSTLSEQVGGELELLAAYMTDPGFRPTIDEKLPTAIDFAYRYLKTDPATVAMDSIEQSLFPEQSSLPQRARMEQWHVRDMERLLKPILTRSPFEVTIVGDISEAQAIEAVAASFGALPRRRALPAGPAQPFKLYPDTPPPPITAFHQGPADRAAAILIWPLYVATPERRQEEYAIGLVAAIFQARLIRQVRVSMGKAYAPLVSDAMPDHADQGILAAAFETAPADIDSLIAATRRIAADLASGAISQEDVDKARQPMIAARLQAQGRNAPWANVLSVAAGHPEAVEELVDYPQQMAALTLDDVKRAAATWLKREPVISKALPASKPAGTSAP